MKKIKKECLNFLIRTKKRKHGERPSRGLTFLHLILQLYVKDAGRPGMKQQLHMESTAKKSPSVFDGLPASIWPSTPAKPRTTRRSNAAVRTHQPDELQKFIDIDRIKSFDELKSGIVNRAVYKGLILNVQLNSIRCIS